MLFDVPFLLFHTCTNSNHFNSRNLLHIICGYGIFVSLYSHVHKQPLTQCDYIWIVDNSFVWFDIGFSYLHKRNQSLTYTCDEMMNCMLVCFLEHLLSRWTFSTRTATQSNQSMCCTLIINHQMMLMNLIKRFTSCLRTNSKGFPIICRLSRDFYFFFSNIFYAIHSIPQYSNSTISFWRHVMCSIFFSQKDAK